MDPSEDNNKTRFLHSLFRISLALFLLVFAFFSLAFLVGISAIFIGESSISNPIFVPSYCKIVSSSVDLRTTKVCELGLLNFKAKHVFYPSERNKYRCRYDYYWASVFKVEYKDHSLGQTRFALTEAPNEALLLNCRPNFGVAWLTKDKFKVNETYACWYASGISKVKLYHDTFFSCQAEDPSAAEMLWRYLILTSKILQSWFSSNERTSYWRWETVAGAVSGFSTSIITICLLRILQHTKSWLPTLHLKRIGLLLVYLSFMGWLSYQYWKRLNLPAIINFQFTR